MHFSLLWLPGDDFVASKATSKIVFKKWSEKVMRGLQAMGVWAPNNSTRTHKPDKVERSCEELIHARRASRHGGGYTMKYTSDIYGARTSG